MNQCVSDSPPNWPRCEAQLIVASHTDRRTSTRVESGRELTPRHHIHFSRSPPQPRQTTLQQSKLRDAPNARTVPPEKGSRPHPESKATSQRAAIPPNDHSHRWNQKLPLTRSAKQFGRNDWGRTSRRRVSLRLANDSVSERRRYVIKPNDSRSRAWSVASTNNATRNRATSSGSANSPFSHVRQSAHG